MSASRKSDLIYCWSISDHAFVASFLRKPLLCAVGGYEFANIPECNYGNMLTFRQRFFTRRVWKTAGLLYVDESLMREAEVAFGHAGERAYYVPTGYDPDYWTPEGSKDGRLVLTVCGVTSPDRVKLKGVDLFIETARHTPELTFAIVGGTDLTGLPSNVRLHDWADREELRRLYRQATVYCQLSLHEGLPNAVCEAMLCGCVPVGTASGGTGTAMGPTGVLVEQRHWKAVQAAIGYALRMDPTAPRRRIIEEFPLSRRRAELKEILEPEVLYA